MKMYGSNIDDTMLGTAIADTIKTLDGNDLIYTAGGADTILMGDGDDLVTDFNFDLAKVNKSDSKGAKIDGGGGTDVMVIDVSADKRVSEVEDVFKAITVKRVDEFIYNFDSIGAKQSIVGSNKSNITETIVVQRGDVVIDMRGGDDYVFTGGGDDKIIAGKGSDFIHAGEGHNSVEGGNGTDYFHFQLSSDYQYTEITDFKADEDKIMISISAEQVNLYFGETDSDWEAVKSPYPTHLYGDDYLEFGDDINDYVSHNFGRRFDISDFDSGEDYEDPLLWGFYEQETGSVFAYHYEMVDDQLDRDTVLIAHIKPGTDIDASDFLVRMV